MKLLLVLVLLLNSLITAGCGGDRESFEDSRFLMDTLLTVKVTGSNKAALQIAAREAISTAEVIAGETDRYKRGSASGLFALNGQAGKDYFPVGDHLYRLLHMTKNQPYKELDVTLGPITDLWNRHKALKDLPLPEELTRALAYTGTDKYDLQNADHSVRLAKGSSLDLGAIAKGYAVDEIYKALTRNKVVSSALINAGGNIRVLGNKPGGGNWHIGIQHPRSPDALLGTVELKAGEALATSGDYQRFYEVNGLRYHHIIDPATGMPAAHAMSVTVLSTSALTTDFFSTLLFVMPRQKALAVLNATPQISALIVYSPDDIYISPGFSKRFRKE